MHLLSNAGTTGYSLLVQEVAVLWCHPLLGGNVRVVRSQRDFNSNMHMHLIETYYN
jgi:hypothetical protein